MFVNSLCFRVGDENPRPQVIPKTVFTVLRELIELETHHLRPLPTKLETTQLAKYAQLDLRYELSRMTYRISVFTEGVLAMQKTLLGVLEVEPRQILEDGIRKELVLRISNALESIDISPKNSPQEVESKLEKLSELLEGFRRSFEYIQDYVSIYGLKVWQVEYSRIINFNVEQECNRYLKCKVLDYQSKFQSRAIPVPRVSLLGTLEKTIIEITAPGATVFAPECSSWYKPSGPLIVGMKFFRTLNKSLGAIGLCGIDRLLSFRIVGALQRILLFYSSEHTKKILPLLHQLAGELSNYSKLPNDGMNVFSNAKVMVCSTHILWSHTPDNPSDVSRNKRQSTWN